MANAPARAPAGVEAPANAACPGLHLSLVTHTVNASRATRSFVEWNVCAGRFATLFSSGCVRGVTSGCRREKLSVMLLIVRDTQVTGPRTGTLVCTLSF